MATTRLGLPGVPWRPYGGFVAKAPAAVASAPFGIEFTLPTNRLHHILPDSRLQHTLPENRLHYTMPAKD